MITVTQHEDQYEIRFPYDQELVELVKNVPGRSWHSETRCWSIPLARLGFFIAQVKGTKYEPQVQIYSKEDLNINASIDESNKVPDIDISDYVYRIQKGLYPFKHQLDSLKFAKWRYENGLKSGFLLADEPGGAKTAQVMNIALYMREKHGLQHCLIIACVNSAKYNWVEDIVKHTDGEEVPYILGTRHHRDGSEKYDTDSAAKLDDLILLKKYGKRGTEELPFFLIMNIEAIRMREGKRYPLAERLIELINNDYIGMVALDEIHHNCVSYDTLVRTDRGLMQIGELVENRLQADVLSYDICSGQLVYKPITEWHATRAKSTLVKLTIQEGDCMSTVICTPDHLFYTRNRGWVAASDLTESDDVFLLNEEGC